MGRVYGRESKDREMNQRCPECNGIAAFVVGQAERKALSDMFKLECMKCRNTWYQVVSLGKEANNGKEYHQAEKH